MRLASRLRDEFPRDWWRSARLAAVTRAVFTCEMVSAVRHRNEPPQTLARLIGTLGGRVEHSA